MTRVNFYEGQPPLDYIESRLAELFHANPWLQSRLLSDNGNLALRHPKSPRDPAAFFRLVRIPGLRFDAAAPAIAEAVKDLGVKRGRLCVDKEEDLFRLSVVNISEDRFALVLSLSHVFADGYTFYAIHKMLSCDEPVWPMIVERVHTLQRDLNEAVGGRYDVPPWFLSPGVIVNVVGSMLRRRASTQSIFAVDQRKIAELKNEYESHNKPKFISTNDVITAEFFAQTACDVVFMPVDFRGRIPHITKSHAGNYEALMGYQREDFARPELIRSGLSNFRRPVSGKLPGFFKSTRAKLGIISNLATTYRDVELPGCKLSFHRPLIDSTALVPFEHAVYVFKSRNDQLSLCACSKEPSVLSRVPVLKERIA